MSYGINCSMLAVKLDLFAERAETERHPDITFGIRIDYLVVRFNKELIFDVQNPEPASGIRNTDL